MRLEAVLVEGDRLTVGVGDQLYTHENGAWQPLATPVPRSSKKRITHLQRLSDSSLAVGMSDASGHLLVGDRWDVLHYGSSWGRHYGFTLQDGVLWFANSHKIGRVELQESGMHRVERHYSGKCIAVAMLDGTPHGLCEEGVVRLREPGPDDRPAPFSPEEKDYDPSEFIATPVAPKMSVSAMTNAGDQLVLAGRSLIELDDSGQRVVAGWNIPKVDGGKDVEVAGGRGPTLRASAFPSLSAIARTGDAITAVGEQAVVWQRDASGTWSLLHHSGNRLHALKFIWGKAADDFATFGWNQTFLVRRGQKWEHRSGVGSWKNLYTDGIKAVAIGSNGKETVDIVYDGKAWGQAKPFDGYDGYPVGWAVSGQRLVYLDGTTRTVDESEPRVAAMWEGGGVRVGVWQSNVHIHDGSAWSATDLAEVSGCPANLDLVAVGGRSGGDIWATSRNGVVAHWNGAAWTCEDVGMGPFTTVEDILLTEDAAFVVVGPYVLRRSRE
jgi:hypothetical protein